MSGLQAIRYSRGRLEVLDQLRLPHEHHYDEVSTSEEAFECIKSMRVRGAPAIAIVAALAHGVELRNGSCKALSTDETIAYIDSRLDYIKQSRPTAVDLSNAITNLKTIIRSVDVSGETDAAGRSAIIEAYIAAAEEIFRKDTDTNRLIGARGVQWLLQNALTKSPDSKISVLTHCNTGSLATSGHGTALGIIRSLHSDRHLKHAFCTETRPYNQGSRLTAFELVYEGIPSTLITDSMAGALFATKKAEYNLAAVIVGADRVARNGDTANKIGTYSLAVLAKYHGLKFIVAAPTTSIDLHTQTGAGIRVEERKPEELTQISGAVVGEDGKVDVGRTERVATAHQGINVWNPAFDVTPAELIDAVVTENGTVEKGPDGSFDFRGILPERWTEAISKPAKD
ncbi:S-methyl-5-thioribose-1-phosphate isomerase [Parahypoxylon ruwenzoriense]